MLTKQVTQTGRLAATTLQGESSPVPVVMKCHGSAEYGRERLGLGLLAFRAVGKSHMLIVNSTYYQSCFVGKFLHLVLDLVSSNELDRRRERVFKTGSPFARTHILHPPSATLRYAFAFDTFYLQVCLNYHSLPVRVYK